MGLNYYKDANLFENGKIILRVFRGNHFETAKELFPLGIFPKGTHQVSINPSLQKLKKFAKNIFIDPGNKVDGMFKSKVICNQNEYFKYFQKTCVTAAPYRQSNNKSNVYSPKPSTSKQQYVTKNPNKTYSSPPVINIDSPGNVTTPNIAYNTENTIRTCFSKFADPSSAVNDFFSLVWGNNFKIDETKDFLESHPGQEKTLKTMETTLELILKYVKPNNQWISGLDEGLKKQLEFIISQYRLVHKAMVGNIE